MNFHFSIQNCAQFLPNLSLDMMIGYTELDMLISGMLINKKKQGAHCRKSWTERIQITKWQ